MNISERREVIRKSRKQERDLSKRVGGYVQPRSGAGPFRKNDVRDKEFLYECKTVMGIKQITLTDKALRDVMKNATLDDRIGVLAFELNTRRYVVLCEDDFEDLKGGR